MATLIINEIFHSIQGESTWAGCPCVFVRLTGCHLRCGYCDTEYAFYEGTRQTVESAIEQVNTLDPTDKAIVEVTGGEPLLQPDVHELMAKLCDAGRTVLLETSGACDIGKCDERVIRIMDIKTPDSGESRRNRWENIDLLTKHDEIKFVLCSREDYDWAKRILEEHDLANRVNAVLMSAVHEMPASGALPGAEGLSLRELAEWVLADRLAVRVQTQLHKLIWDPMARGV